MDVADPFRCHEDRGLIRMVFWSGSGSAGDAALVGSGLADGALAGTASGVASPSSALQPPRTQPASTDTTTVVT
jgi:hypothetical protein